MKNLFSIVVPVHNRAEIVGKTLDGLKQQTYRPIHLILVDNNSSDDTCYVLREWQSRNQSEDFKVTIATESTPGAAAARNKGLTLVESEYMAFFDSDDIMRQNCVDEYMSAFCGNPNLDIVCCDSLYHTIDGKSHILGFRKGNLMHNHIYHATLRTLGYAVKTEYIKNCGGWNPKLFVWDDWELGIRLLLDSPNTISLGKILNDVYLQSSSITGLDFSSKAGQWEYALDTVDAAISKSVSKEKKTLHRLIDYRRIILAAHYRKEGNDRLAHTLYKSVMMKRKNDFVMRLLMPIAYHYTALGGRGAALFVDPFL